MRHHQVLKVFEHQRLLLGHKVGDAEFRQEHLEALEQFNDQHQNKFFTRIHNGIKFAQYVGVLQVGNLTIEVLPKADKADSGAESTKDKWHHALLNMLKDCHLLKLESLSNAHLQYKSNSILELYIEIFINQVEQLVHEGLVKKYRQREGNLYKLKGALQFNRHLSQNLVHKERFYTRYTTYDHQHLLNQLLLQTLRLLMKLPAAASFVGRIKNLILFFPEMPDRRVNASTFDQLHLDRKTKRYETALQIAKLFLLNFSPDIRGGRNDLLAILFDMNLLFEEWVFRQLQQAQAKHGFQVKRQQNQVLWGSRKIRPDLVLTYQGKTYIMDTKWKVLEQERADISDLQQMFIYNSHFNACESILLYPQVDAPIDVAGVFNTLLCSPEGRVSHSCRLLSLDFVKEDGSLDKEIWGQVEERLFGKSCRNQNAK